ncbi:glycosyltransferase [Myxosarcina sp. GI1(2024)]
MKLLHLWQGDSGHYGGGGAVAMYRLHSSLLEASIDSKILCQHKTIQSLQIDVFQIPLVFKVLERLLQQITSRLGLNDIHRLSSFNLRKYQVYSDANIIHFHGLQGFINYLALPALTRDKPSVFTLHNMWALTGHCNNSYDCERWKSGCGRCPHLDIHPAVSRDSTHIEWQLKDWTYRQLQLTLICPSKWMVEQAKQSPLLNRFPIHYIPHGIDTESFQPLDSLECRSQLGIPHDKKVLLFAAVNISHYRKGGDLLVKALQNLPESLKQDTVLVVFGKETEAIAKLFDLPVYHLGYLSDDRSKAVAYSAADLFLFPTRADVFGLVSIESQACGTPVVSFGVGGVPDHVRPGVTGYLAEPENVADLRQGIVQLLADDELRQRLSQQCRAIALQEYDSKLWAARHAEIYSQLLDPSPVEKLEEGVILNPI